MRIRSGDLGCQRPFLISANPNSPSYVADAPDITGGFNGRYDQEVSIDRGKMDDFLVDVEAGQPILGPTPSPEQVEAHNEAIGIEGVYDCDTVPYLWYYAKNFTLFDHYFQANTGDSTPSNIQLFAGQIGQTEAAAGEGILSQPVPSGGYSDGVPISNDDNPPSSQLRFHVTPYSGDNGTFQSYATMPVLLNPAMDRAAKKSRVVGYIGRDISKEARTNRASFPWAWYEEGSVHVKCRLFGASYRTALLRLHQQSAVGVRDQAYLARQHAKQRFDFRHQTRKAAGRRASFG